MEQSDFIFNQHGRHFDLVLDFENLLIDFHEI